MNIVPDSGSRANLTNFPAPAVADINHKVYMPYILATTPGELVLSIVTPAAVDLRAAGIVGFREREILGGRVAGTGTLTYDAAIFTVSTETIPITDERLGGTWGESLMRVVFHAARPPQAGSWRFRFVHS